MQRLPAGISAAGHGVGAGSGRKVSWYLGSSAAGQVRAASAEAGPPGSRATGSGRPTACRRPSACRSAKRWISRGRWATRLDLSPARRPWQARGPCPSICALEGAWAPTFVRRLDRFEGYGDREPRVAALCRSSAARADFPFETDASGRAHSPESNSASRLRAISKPLKAGRFRDRRLFRMRAAPILHFQPPIADQKGAWLPNFRFQSVPWECKLARRATTRSTSGARLSGGTHVPGATASLSQSP